MLAGWADPMKLLAIDQLDPDWKMACEVIERADAIREQRLSAFLANLQVVVQNGVGRAFGGR